MHVIVWDLDGTLGDFSPLSRLAERADPVTVRVRPGLAESLQRLADAGFVHTLLTLATPRYAAAALGPTGLRPFFRLVEGLGQRGKGDAAGVGNALGIAPDDRPHRMFFVGDHPHFDEPRDPRVVFHLEFCALSRPAGDLEKLLLHLRELGGGSIRHGFDRLGRQLPWWKRVWPGSMRPGKPLPRCIEGLGDVVLLHRTDSCPVIGFRDPPPPGVSPSEHLIVPEDLPPV